MQPTMYRPEVSRSAQSRSHTMAYTYRTRAQIPQLRARQTTNSALTQELNQRAWWTGPEFLQHHAEEWPQMRITVPDQLPGEVKKKLAMSFATQADSWRLAPSRYSSWKRLVRVTSWCLRFIERCRSRVRISLITREEISGRLTVEELNQAERLWIQRAQRDAYPSTFNLLEAGKSLPPSDPLVKLHRSWTPRQSQ